MKKRLLIVIVFLFFCCSILKTNPPYKNTYKELDSVTIANMYSNFTIDIPQNWYGYIESHNLLAISPREFLEGTKTNMFNARNNVALVIREMSQKECNCKTLDDALNYSVSNFKKSPLKISYEVVESNHSYYGKIYIVKNTWKRNSVSTVSSALVIIKHKEKQFTLNFSSLPKFYNKYVKQSSKMIESFRIK